MAAHADQIESVDPGLAVLVALLRFQGISVDAAQLLHRFGQRSVGVAEMLRCAKDFDLKARAYRTSWKRLAATPLPGIAVLRDGSFLLLAKVGDEKAVVLLPASPRATLMTRSELEALWDGQLVLMTRRAGLLDLSRRFDITWFLGAIHKYRYVLGRVLVASFFLQLFALVSPLFFQVVIDKVLVHRSLSGCGQNVIFND
jgi:subfamily B ATP-binding cassette protein HlyB/CyaB